MKTIIGLFENYGDADNAITKLQNIGISRDNISVIAHESSLINQNQEADVTDGVQAGLAGGATIGGITGLIAGISAIVIPGVGPIITAGTLATALGSTIAGAGLGAAAGGIVGALVDLGVSEEEAQWYAEGVNRGNILISADVEDNQVHEVRNILDESHAIDMETKGTWEPVATTY